MRINKAVVNTVSGLASEITDKNQYLVGKYGTTLNDLSQVIQGSMAVAVTNPLETTNADEYVTTMAEYILMEKNDVDIGQVFRDNVKEVLSGKLKSDLSFMRTVIKPVLMDTIEEVREKVDAAEKELQKSTVEMVVLRLPKLMTYPEMDDYFESETTPPRKLMISSGRITLQTISNPDVFEAFKKYNNSSINTDELVEWVQGLDRSLMRTWLDTYFTNIGPTNPAYQDLRSSISVADADKVFFIHMFARSILQNPPATYKVDTRKYQRVLKEVVRYTRSILSTIRRIMVTRTEGDFVVATVVDNKIYVYGPTLDRFLEENPVDVVYGAAVAKENLRMSYRTIGSLVEHKEELINLWKRYVSVRDKEQRVVNKAKVKMILRDVFVNNFNIISDREQAVRDNYPELFNVTEYLSKRLEDILNDLEVDEFFEDMDEEIMEMLMEYRFPYMDAKSFFDDLLEISEHNTDMDPKDVASIAGLRYMIRYICSNLRVVQ